MKLKIVPARTGALWVKLGIQTFFKQPLALAGLFFMFMAVMTIASLVPWIGFVLAMTFLPGATLGLMAATKEATQGRFPMPTILLAAFRAGKNQGRAMLTLGALYALGFLVAMGASWLVDGGDFAQVYLGGSMPERARERQEGGAAFALGRKELRVGPQAEREATRSGPCGRAAPPQGSATTS